VGLSGGTLDIYSSKSLANLKIGYYFYDPNSYNVNNRIYLDMNYIDSSADFYITNLKIDWIKNNELFSPFVGLSVGYIYYNENDNDYSTTAWGINGGLLINITSSINFELSASWQKAMQKKDVWNKNIRSLEGGIILNF
jgi:hypothetical protein